MVLPFPLSQENIPFILKNLAFMMLPEVFIVVNLAFMVLPFPLSKENIPFILKNLAFMVLSEVFIVVNLVFMVLPFPLSKENIPFILAHIVLMWVHIGFNFVFCSNEFITRCWYLTILNRLLSMPSSTQMKQTDERKKTINSLINSAEH
jgi:hypothetical protein